MRNGYIRVQLGVDGVVEQTGRKRKVWKVVHGVGISITEIFVEMSGMVQGRRPRKRQREQWNNAYSQILKYFIISSSRSH